jgi:hypothetical protein
MVEWQGITVYVPSEGEGWLGYHNFPGIPSEGAMERLALRSGRLEDGFISLP